MAVVTTSVVAEFIQTVIGKAVDDEIANHLFFPGAAASQWISFRDLTDRPGISSSFNKYNTLTAVDLVEGTDLTATSELDPSAVTLTATESGLKSVVTNLAKKAMGSPNDAQAYAEDLVRNHMAAIMTKFDVDVFSLFAGLNAGFSSTGVNLTNAGILSAVDLAAKANMPQPWAGFLHPQQYSDLVNESGSPFAAAAASGSIAEGFYGNYFIGRFYGVNWFVNTNVQTANANADRVGAILSPRAIGAVISQMPVTVYENDASLRGEEVITVATYAVGEIDGTMGMYILSDA